MKENEFELLENSVELGLEHHYVVVINRSKKPIGHSNKGRLIKLLLEPPSIKVIRN